MTQFLNLLTGEAAWAVFAAVYQPDITFERVRVAGGLHRVLAQDAAAPHDLPTFVRSTVDGYAVSAADTHGASSGMPAYLDVVAEAPMGQIVDFVLGPGKAALVHTGGMVPRGADAVVMIEQTHRAGGPMFGGQALLFLSLPDVQRLFAASQPVATFLITPPGTAAPAGKASFDRDDAFNDLLRPLSNARNSILFVTILLWIVAACIVGSIVYLSAMERTRDFAVFKATGTSNGSLAGGLAIQAVILSVAAAILAAIIATLLAPVFPLPVEIPMSAYLWLFVIAIAVGLLASLAGLRRAVKVEPALAFGGP
jgi:hypothetical protein